jgi:integrase
MSGMNPAFIAQQLGHSVQMLLSTYARWLNSSGDRGEMEKLQNAPKNGPSAKCAARNPLIGKVIDLHS